MNFVTVGELNQDILDGLQKIPRDIDVIVGVPRSGILVASLIALYLNKPLTDIDGFIKKSLYSSGSTKNTYKNVKGFSEVKKVLIVEDSSMSGNSIKEAKKKLEYAFDEIKKIYFAAYVTNDSKQYVDIWLREIDDRVFEWNYMHHSILKNACVDIDGILCVDPTSDENDDGERYKNFILNAQPKYIPTRKIGYLVTSRLEKYRPETEKWLENNGIEYGELIMLEGVTAEERRQKGFHGTFKAKVYKSIPTAKLFIESEPSQAKIISQKTQKNVFCPQGSMFFKESFFYSNKLKLKENMHFLMYKLISSLPGYNRWKHVLKKILNGKKRNDK